MRVPGSFFRRGTSQNESWSSFVFFWYCLCVYVCVCVCVYFWRAFGTERLCTWSRPFLFCYPPHYPPTPITPPHYPPPHVHPVIELSSECSCYCGSRSWQMSRGRRRLRNAKPLLLLFVVVVVVVVVAGGGGVVACRRSRSRSKSFWLVELIRPIRIVDGCRRWDWPLIFIIPPKKMEQPFCFAFFYCGGWEEASDRNRKYGPR